MAEAKNPATPAPTDGETLASIRASAQRLGVELDEAEAARWVDALRAETAGGEVVVDVDTGIFGHRVTMLDFAQEDLARFRAIGQVVGLPDRPPAIRTALAISGSAAQGRIQAFPGDCDYFQRVHIVAPTRAEACTMLGELIRAKALETVVGTTYRLWEVKFGSYPEPVERNGATVSAGSPISWSPDELRAGAIDVVRGGRPATITWADAAADPGWCKLDWIVADPVRRALANASNVLDATWEAPDGTIVALDGVLDPYYPEVYLEAESLPVFTKLVHQLSAGAVDEYVGQLEGEVRKYATVHPNFGKVARRLYNIFRLTGRYAEAAYVRELFDEPATALYQVAALIRTLDDAERPGGAFDRELVLRQLDELIMAAVAALEGASEQEMVRALLEVRQSVAAEGASETRSASVQEVTEVALAETNAYFLRRLTAVPSIAAFLESVTGVALG